MKSSIVLIVLLVFNTTAIFSESISNFIKGIDIWVLLLNSVLKDINRTFEMELNDLNFYPKKRKN